MRRSVKALCLCWILASACLTAQAQSVSVTATGGAGCDVVVNDTIVSTHAQKHKAQAEATNRAFANPGAQVEFHCNDVFRVTVAGAAPAPQPDPAPPPDPTPTPSPPPAIQFSVDASGLVTATWSAVQGATSYVLDWSNDSGGGGKRTITGTSTAIPGLVEGQVCITPSGGSQFCERYTPATPPPAPGAASQPLYWDPVSIADGYKVHVGTAPRTYSAPIPVGQVTTYTVTGLQAGTRYYFTVTATKAGAPDSVYSNEVSKQF